MSKYSDIIKTAFPHRNAKNYENKFAIFEKLDKINGPMLTHEFNEVLSVAKEYNVAKYYISNFFPYKFTSEQIDALIDTFKKGDAFFVINLLKRDDLNEQQIQKIIDIFEDTVGNFGVCFETEKLSPAVHEYVARNCSHRFEEWDYYPVVYSNNNEMLECIVELLKKEPYNERLMTAIASNTYLPEQIRNEAFDNGCNIASIKNPTKYMASSIYETLTDTIFECDANKDTRMIAIEILKHYLSKSKEYKNDVFSRGCLIDLAKRLNENTKINNSEKRSIMSNMIQDIKDSFCLTDIVAGREWCIQKVILRDSIHPAIYETIRPHIAKKDDAQELLLKTLLEHIPQNTEIFKEFINIENKNFLKALLIMPNTPQKIIDDITWLGDSELKALSYLRQTMGKARTDDAINKTNVNFRPFQYFAYRTMKTSTAKTFICYYLEIGRKPFVISDKYVDDVLEGAKHYFSTFENLKHWREIIEDCEKIAQQEKCYSDNKIFCFQCGKETFEFNVEKMNQYTEEYMKKSISIINQINNPIVLEYLLHKFEEGIMESSSYYQEIDVAVYKFTDLFNAINNRIKEIEKEYRENNIDFLEINDGDNR